MTWVAVAIGGVVGTLLRDVLQRRVNPSTGGGLPAATLLINLGGAFLLHTAPGVRKISEDAEGRGKYEKVCIGTTTSARMVRFTEGLGEQYGVRAICGKGGFPDVAMEPMQRPGRVYCAIVGGAAALE